MDTMSVVGFISLVIGLVSFAYSIGINKQTRREQQVIKEILDKIDTAIKDWHDKIMQSNIELIESQPTIVAKRSQIEDSKIKNESVRQLLDKIKHIIENLPPEADAKPQIAVLNLLLHTLPNIVRPLPEEDYLKMVKERRDNKPEQNQPEPDQPKKS